MHCSLLKTPVYSATIVTDFVVLDHMKFTGARWRCWRDWLNNPGLWLFRHKFQGCRWTTSLWKAVLIPILCPPVVCSRSDYLSPYYETRKWRLCWLECKWLLIWDRTTLRVLSGAGGSLSDHPDALFPWRCCDAARSQPGGRYSSKRIGISDYRRKPAALCETGSQRPAEQEIAVPWWKCFTGR